MITWSVNEAAKSANSLKMTEGKGLKSVHVVATSDQRPIVRKIAC